MSVPLCTHSVNHSCTHCSYTLSVSLSSDGVLAFTDKDISSLRLMPFEEQIQALVELERFEEALLLLDGVQSHRPTDSYKVKCNY